MCTRLVRTGQDWRHPVRHHLKKTRGLEPAPNPNLAPEGLQSRINLNEHKNQKLRARPSPNLVPTCSRQVHLFRIGGIQSGCHLKRTRGNEPDPTKPCTRLVWTGPPGSRLLKASGQGSISRTQEASRHTQPKPRTRLV